MKPYCGAAAWKARGLCWATSTNGLAATCHRLLQPSSRARMFACTSAGKRTYPAIFPVMHLDHVYYDPQLEVERVALHRSKTSLVASDHVPLVVDFKLE